MLRHIDWGASTCVASACVGSCTSDDSPQPPYAVRRYARYLCTVLSSLKQEGSASYTNALSFITTVTLNFIAIHTLCRAAANAPQSLY